MFLACVPVVSHSAEGQDVKLVRSIRTLHLMMEILLEEVRKLKGEVLSGQNFVLRVLADKVQVLPGQLPGGRDGVLLAELVPPARVSGVARWDGVSIHGQVWRSPGVL